MNHISQSDVSWAHRKSPKGGFEFEALNFGAEMSARDSGHPFEVMLIRIPPGKRPWPYHSHASQWEFYTVLEGEGEMRLEAETVAIRAGDAMMCPPGEAHQLHNTGQSDLLIQIIADNPPADTCNYPDSGKWACGGKVFRMDVTTYYDGEE